jgi:hypothetical protein
LQAQVFRMTVLKSLLLWIAGLAAGLFLFDRANLALAGSSWTWSAHLALAALAALILAGARRVRFIRPALVSLGLCLLALTIASALLFPALIRAEALKTAKGRPFCLVGPEVSADPDSDRRNPYILAPSLARTGSLTLLTLPRPLTLVVERPADLPDPAPGGRPDSVFMPFDWGSFGRRFREAEYKNLRKPGDSLLLDCEPMMDPFDAAVASVPAALIVWRDPLPDAEGAPGWGPRQRALLRIPADATPIHGGRFRNAEIGFTSALLPGADPLSVTLAWVPDATGWLQDRLRERVRDQDVPLDWAALPVNGLGLTAYEVPSTSVADAIDGTYTVPGPDGGPVTVIACSPHACRHHVRLDPAASRVVTLRYPADILPDWQRLQAAAGARIAPFVVPPQGPTPPAALGSDLKKG